MPTPTMVSVQLPRFEPELISLPDPPAADKEVLVSGALSILIVLLIIALFTSYILQTRKIQAVHETVLSIFAGAYMQLGVHYQLG